MDRPQVLDDVSILDANPPIRGSDASTVGAPFLRASFDPVGRGAICGAVSDEVVFSAAGGLRGLLRRG